MPLAWLIARTLSRKQRICKMCNLIKKRVLEAADRHDKAAANVKEVRAVKKKLHTLKIVFVRLKSWFMG